MNNQGIVTPSRQSDSSLEASAPAVAIASSLVCSSCMSSVFSSRAVQWQALAAFHLSDSNGDGLLEPHDMHKHMRIVLKVRRWHFIEGYRAQ